MLNSMRKPANISNKMKEKFDPDSQFKDEFQVRNLTIFDILKHKQKMMKGKVKENNKPDDILSKAGQM